MAYDKILASLSQYFTKPSLRGANATKQSNNLHHAPAPPCVIIGLDPIILPESAHVQMLSVAEHGSKPRNIALCTVCCMEIINMSLSRQQQAEHFSFRNSSIYGRSSIGEKCRFLFSQKPTAFVYSLRCPTPLHIVIYDKVFSFQLK